MVATDVRWESDEFNQMYVHSLIISTNFIINIFMVTFSLWVCSCQADVLHPTKSTY